MSLVIDPDAERINKNLLLIKAVLTKLMLVGFRQIRLFPKTETLILMKT